MPYKSDAQRKKFHEMAGRGEISKDVVAKFDSESKGMKLPERVTPPKAPKGAKSIQDLKQMYKDKYGK